MCILEEKILNACVCAGISGKGHDVCSDRRGAIITSRMTAFCQISRGSTMRHDHVISSFVNHVGSTSKIKTQDVIFCNAAIYH